MNFLILYGHVSLELVSDWSHAWCTNIVCPACSIAMLSLQFCCKRKSSMQYICDTQIILDKSTLDKSDSLMSDQHAQIIYHAQPAHHRVSLYVIGRLLRPLLPPSKSSYLMNLFSRISIFATLSNN